MPCNIHAQYNSGRSRLSLTLIWSKQTQIYSPPTPSQTMVAGMTEPWSKSHLAHSQRPSPQNKYAQEWTCCTAGAGRTLLKSKWRKNEERCFAGCMYRAPAKPLWQPPSLIKAAATREAPKWTRRSLTLPDSSPPTSPLWIPLLFGSHRGYLTIRWHLNKGRHEAISTYMWHHLLKHCSLHWKEKISKLS